MALSRLLHRLFVVVAFKWNIEKLQYLKQSIVTVLDYPTHVDACIVTNNGPALANVLSDWDFGESLWICDTERDVNDTNEYALLFEHRQVMQQAYEGEFRHFYTAYMYMEDDTEVPWKAMLWWAGAVPKLEPLGFIPGFYRTEVGHTGEKILMDAEYRVDLADYDRIVHVRDLGDFIQLPDPFNGMWLASHEQLKQFVASRVWSKEGALKEKLPEPAFDHYPERSNWWLQLLHVPAGFWSRSLVPFSMKEKRLNDSARVIHMRNGYASHQTLGHWTERTVFV